MHYIDYINNKKVSLYYQYNNTDIIEVACSGFAPNFKLKIPVEHGISLKEYCEKVATKEEFDSLTFENI